MDKRIIFQDQNGKARILEPAPECRLTIEEIAAKDVPPGVPFEIVDTSTLPPYRAFRDAWVINGKVISADITKAKLIAHAIRREKRKEAFAPLDIDATIPAKAKQAEAARQVIRDADALTQAAIDAAKNDKELEQIFLDRNS